jgi:hypothetical protein
LLLLLLLFFVFFFFPPFPHPFPFLLANVWRPHVLLLRVSSQRCMYFSLSVAARQMSGLLRMPWSFWGAVGFSTAAIYWHCFADCCRGLVMSTNRQEGFEQIIHIARITEIDLDCFSK